MPRAALCLPVLVLVLGIGFTAESTRVQHDLRLEGIPHVRQLPDFCGEACVAMVLGKLGHAGDQEWVWEMAQIDPLIGRGCVTRELKQSMERIGFDVGPVWHPVPVATADATLNALWQTIVTDLEAGLPSLVCMRTGDGPTASEHIRLVVGWRPVTQEVLYHEPAESAGAYRVMPLKDFLACWPLKYQIDPWTAIRFRCAVRELIPFAPPVAGHREADYCQHYRKLKAQVPEGFTVVLERPCFVIGNGSAQQLRTRWAERTIRWAIARLKTIYFPRDPLKVLDIWLFKDDTTYMAWAEKLWGSKPSTPFGYYSSAHGALAMNISTGGGTLIHELVHPFMEANFPDCPDWFNEGMGSLYEQCADKDDKIVGLTNWRLQGLQEAIEADELMDLVFLTDTAGFYTKANGYAMARYLCYYLQSKGLLEQYYQAFTAAVEADPTGLETLKKVLDEPDLEAFQKRWEQWVMTLKFPPST